MFLYTVRFSSQIPSAWYGAHEVLHVHSVCGTPSRRAKSRIGDPGKTRATRGMAMFREELIRLGSACLLLTLVSSVILLPLPVAAQATCNLLGEVFVTNPFDQTLMIKGDGSADIKTVRFSDQTEFIRVTVERKPAGTFDPKNLQTGDRLCVQSSATPARAADRVVVMKRSDIQEHQRLVFSALARNSAFGVVTELNAEHRTIRLSEELESGAAQEVTVDASDPVAFRHYSSEGQSGNGPVASAWSRLKVGDHLYVQGKRDAALSAIHAGIIIDGGVRGITGTITSMSGLGEVIGLQELGSRNLLEVQTRRVAMFRASPFVEPPIAGSESGSSAAWDLYPISFSDFQKGDTISVLAKDGERSKKTVIGMMVITGFGSYGINASPSGLPVFWFIDPLKASN